MHIKSRKNRIFIFVTLLFLIISCSKKEEESYIVKVGDSYLSEAMIEESLNSNKDDHKFREEFIREWIESKLINLDALENGVVDSEEYRILITSAKIEIANALAIKKNIYDNSVKVTNKELENFYINKISEFKIASEKLVFNQVAFTNRKDAAHFRKLVVRDGWENSINKFSNSEIQISVKKYIFEYVYNIINENLKIQLAQLDEGEYSGVVEISKNIFVIIELVKRYDKNEAPEFEEIKDEVEQKYISFNRTEIYNNYLKELYTKYSSEIER